MGLKKFKVQMTKFYMLNRINYFYFQIFWHNFGTANNWSQNPNKLKKYLNLYRFTCWWWQAFTNIINIHLDFILEKKDKFLITYWHLFITCSIYMYTKCIVNTTCDVIVFIYMVLTVMWCDSLSTWF